MSKENQPRFPEANEVRQDDSVVVKEKSETPLESLSSICAVLAVGLFVMPLVSQNFVIPSGSMEKTLLIGDHILVDRITFAPPTAWAPFVRYREPQRGDVIVFLKPNPETPDLILVKRLIAVPGDRIHLVHGVVYLNGVAQIEPYAAMPHDGGDEQDVYNPARDDFPTNGTPYGAFEVWSQELASHVQNGEVVVPPGNFFAMGDNREHSADGRFWGFVPRENILGRPLFNYWSSNTTASDGRTASEPGRAYWLLFHHCSAPGGQNSVEQDRAYHSLARRPCGVIRHYSGFSQNGVMTSFRAGRPHKSGLPTTVAYFRGRCPAS